MYQGGNVYHYDLKTQKTTFIKPVHPTIKNLRYNWNAAIATIPGSPNSLYFGSQFLHLSDNKGISWKVVSPDLTTNDTSKLHQEKSGGLTIDATGAENYCTIISIAPSPINPKEKVIIGTDDGQVQISTDGFKSWNLLTKNILGLPKNAWIPMIVIDTNRARGKLTEDIWVVANNYRQNDWKPYLFLSTDNGITWKSMITPDVKGYSLSVHIDPIDKNLVFLGTDQGLWVSFDGGNNWKKWTKFPSCPVQDIKFQSIENDLVIGTFGRGIWVIDDISVLRKFTQKLNHSKTIEILSATHGYVVDYMQSAGMRFGADGVWTAPNKPYGCNLSIYVNSTKKDGDWQKQDFEGLVFDSENKQIRKHKFSFDSTGFYRIQWRMIEDGFYFPSHQTPKPEETLPSGRIVKPGKYKLVIQQKLQRFDSAWVEVMYPMNDFNQSDYESQSLAIQKFKPLVEKGYQIFEGLKSMDKNLVSLSELSWESDSIKTYIQKNKSRFQDSLKTLKSLFMLSEEITYYEESTIRLNTLLDQANGYIFQRSELGENMESSLALIEKELNSITNRVNLFIEKEWQPFENKVKSQKFKVITEIKKY
jgi:hypothetical protein